MCVLDTLTKGCPDCILAWLIYRGEMGDLNSYAGEKVHFPGLAMWNQVVLGLSAMYSAVCQILQLGIPILGRPIRGNQGNREVDTLL